VCKGGKARRGQLSATGGLKKQVRRQLGGAVTCKFENQLEKSAMELREKGRPGGRTYEGSIEKVGNCLSSRYKRGKPGRGNAIIRK